MYNPTEVAQRFSEVLEAAELLERLQVSLA